MPPPIHADLPPITDRVRACGYVSVASATLLIAQAVVVLSYSAQGRLNELGPGFLGLALFALAVNAGAALTANWGKNAAGLRPAPAALRKFGGGLAQGLAAAFVLLPLAALVVGLLLGHRP